MTVDRRQAASLEKMSARFDAVSARFQRVYGLRLPRHMAVFAAFWDSLSKTEHAGMRRVGLGPSGITEYFDEGGLDLICRGGLDERLHYRYRRDPPEFVTIMSGDSDGMHFGLWYDDPAHLPAFVVHNWARDDPTCVRSATTPLAAVRDELLESDQGGSAVAAALQAADAFAEADRQAWVDDGGSPLTDVERVPVSGTAGLVFPPGSGDPLCGTDIDERIRAYYGRSSDLRDWMLPHAKEELAAGRPAFAAVLAHELRFEDLNESRAEAWQLLADAYRTLRRSALADIAVVHHDNLDLSSVAVLTRPLPPEPVTATTPST